MKKIFVILIVFSLSFSFADAQTVAVSDNIFKNTWSVITQALDSAVSFVADLFSREGKRTEDDWRNQQSRWSSEIDCDEAKKGAGDYADAKDEIDEKRKVYTTIGLPGGVDRGSVEKYTPPITVPKQPIDYTPKPGAFKCNDALAVTEDAFDSPYRPTKKDILDYGKLPSNDPCEELRRDKKAAEDAARDPNGIYSDKEQEKAAENAKNIQDAIDKCCLGGPIGGVGGDKGSGDKDIGDPANPIGPDLPPNPENPDEPPEEPPVNPDPGPIVGDRYVCDFTSQSYNNLYNCIVASGPVQPGELFCDINSNQEIPVTQEVEKMFLWIFPYTDTVTEMVTYNPACFKGGDPSNPDNPIIIPGPGDPGDGSGGGDDSGNPPSAPKPGVPENPDDGEGPINPISCRIPTFSFYDKLAKPPKYVSNLFTTQKIVENPTLEYYAQDCDTCKLVITSEDGNDVSEFILNNGLFKGTLEPTGATDEENERYIFEASYIKLDTRGLKPGDYIISIHCTDPVFGGPVIGMRKFTTGEEYPPWLKLTIAPEIRWREVVPVISGQAE